MRTTGAACVPLPCKHGQAQDPPKKEHSTGRGRSSTLNRVHKPNVETMGFAAAVHVKHPELKTKPRNALNRRGLLCRQRLCEILAIREGKPLDTPGGASGLGIHWA